MTCSEVFFESFNMSVEAAYDAYFKIAEKDILKGLGGNEDELRSYLANEAARWGGTPLDGLDGMTPGEYLCSVDGLDNLLLMFREGAVICDDALPGIYLDKLRSFGNEAVDALLGFCRDRSLLDGGEVSFMTPLMAVQVLGEWKTAEAVEELTGMLDYRGDVCDLLYEKVGAALRNIGKPAIDGIIKAMESRAPDSPQNEHLMSALADAASRSRSEAAYRCLKNTFLNMSNKAVGAYCLGNYGDGRAVPALRGYLLKNRKDLDKETFFDIVSAVNRLGGDSGDLGSWEDQGL